MNQAETSLRRDAHFGGAPARAVEILNTWDVVKRQKFRNAYLGDDWMTVFTLCLGMAHWHQLMQRSVLAHLMDATDRRREDRRAQHTPEFAPDRRQNERREFKHAYEYPYANLSLTPNAAGGSCLQTVRESASTSNVFTPQHPSQDHQKLKRGSGACLPAVVV